MAIGDTVQAGLMRTDSSPILLAGQAQAKANQAFGDALNTAAQGYFQGQEKKKKLESTKEGLRSLFPDAPDGLINSMAKNPEVAQTKMALEKLAIDRERIASAAASAGAARAQASAFQQDKLNERNRILKEEEEAKQKQIGLSKFIMSGTEMDPEVLEDFNQAQPGLIALGGDQGARNRFLEYQRDTAPKVGKLGGELDSSEFASEAIKAGVDPVLAGNYFMNLQKAEQANTPKPMTTLQLQEYKIKEAEENRRQTEFNERNQNPSENLSVGQETIDREFAKDIVEFNPADIEKGLTQLQEASARLGGTAKDADGKAIEPENLTGAMIGLMPDSFNDIFNPKASEVKEAVEEVVQRNLRLVLGAQFTEKEGQRLISRAYNPRLDEKENKKRVDRLIKSIEGAMQQKQDQARYFNEKGTLKGYQFAPVSIESIERDAFDGSNSQPNVNTFNPGELDNAIQAKRKLLEQRTMMQQTLDNPNVPNYGSQ